VSPNPGKTGNCGKGLYDVTNKTEVPGIQLLREQAQETSSTMRAKIYLIVLLLLVTAQPLQAAERLTWEQCASEARQAHPDLYSALAVLQQAESDKRITKGAQLPQLSIGASSQESGSTAKASSASSRFSYSISASQLLFDGHKTANLVSSNEESIKAAQQNYRAISSDVRFFLRSAFADLLKAQDLVALVREIAARRSNNERLINLRYQGGREHIGSLRQAEADLASAMFDVSQAERGLLLAQAKLASAIGRDQHTPLSVEGEFRPKELSTVKPDIALLVKQHPLFQELDAQSRAARYALDASRSAFAPQLSLTASVGRSAIDQLPVNPVDWNGGVTLSIPIYEGGSGRARISRAMAVLSQDNAREKSGYLQLYDSLEESWKGFLDARQLVMVRKKFLDAAVERSTIANAQYSNGLLSFNEWIIIENNLVSGKKEYLNAEANLLIAEAQWIHAKGGGLESQQE
jgi:outer membrane protein TolC